MNANILIRHDRAHAYVRCRCEAEGHDCCLEKRRDTPCDASINYLTGRKPPNYPVPAIPDMKLWDFQLWCILECIAANPL